MPHLLVIGASGVLGSAAASHFLEKGFTVTAFVRNENKAAALKDKGAIIRVGDLTDPQTLKGVCTNADIVLTAAHGLLGKGRNKSKNVDEAGHRLLMNEAKASGVKQFIYTSISNASPGHAIDFVRSKYAIEEYLKKSGLPYSILRLPAFMETHAWFFLGKNIKEKGKTAILGKGIQPVNFVAIRDVVAALDTIALNEQYYNATIPVAGPQNISRNEIADLFGKALGIKPKISHVPVGALKILSVLLKPFHPGIARIMQLTIAAEKTKEIMTTNDSIERFGKKPTGMEEFIASVLNKK